MSSTVSGATVSFSQRGRHRHSHSTEYQGSPDEHDADIPLLLRSPQVDDTFGDTRRGNVVWGTEVLASRIDHSPPTPCSPFARLAILTALFLTLLSFLLSLSTSLSTLGYATPSLSYITGHVHPSSYRPAQLDSLRRPSQYIGLSRVPEIAKMLEWRKKGHTTARPEIVDYEAVLPPLPNAMGGPSDAQAFGPWSVARINSDHPGRVHTLDSEEGWILLSEEDSVVARFKLSDSAHRSPGIQCAFHAQFPSRDILRTSDRLVTIEGPPDVSPPSASVAFYSLAKSASNQNYQLYWRSPPSQGGLLGSMEISFGANTSTSAFNCPLSGEENDEVWALMVCSGKGCRVEYRELSGEPRAGKQTGIPPTGDEY